MKRLLTLFAPICFLLFSWSVQAQDYLMNADPVTTCSGNFYDNGGPASNYSGSQFVTKTFTGTGGQRLQFNFQVFSTEACCDYLEIYDGPGVTSPLVGRFQGNTNPGLITSTGSSMTFRFGADNSGSSLGWAAAISCAGPALNPIVMANGTVNSCSGAFYDSGGPTGAYLSNENLTQTFCSDNGQKIQFNFGTVALDLGTADTLFAYDGNSTSAPLLAALVSGSRAETLTSTGTCLTFRFKSDATSQGNGWAATYSCVASSPAPTTYQMSTGIRGVCNGVFTDDGGISNNYGNSQFRSQTFKALAGQRLRFSFAAFNTEGCCDYLEIFDGPTTSHASLGRFGGSNSPGIIQSSGDALTFRFYADGGTSSSGFAASIECFDTALPVFNMSTGTVNACSGVFYDAGGAAGSYGIGELRTQTFCSGNGQKIQFQFNPNATNFGNGDTLLAFDGNSISAPLIGAYVAGSRIENITSSGTCITFRFKSDLANTNGTGWQAAISCTSSNPDPIEYRMSPGIRAVCSGTFTDDGGLASNYSNSQFVSQTFQSVAGQRLKFTFQQFSLESCCDYLEVYDGNSVNVPLIGRYYSGIPSEINSTGNSLTFRFYSDGGTSAGGFAASISCFDSALPSYLMSNGVTTTCSGVFYDSGGPSANHGNNENRTQTFCSGTSDRIVFNFNNQAFALGTNDTLFVYDGNSSAAPLVGAFVNGSRVETLTSRGTCLTFQFKSDLLLTSAQGWQAQISCSAQNPALVEYRMSAGIRGVCSGTFTDDGGASANYSNSQFRTQVFQSRNGERLRFTFQQFTLESCCDYLEVFDGSSVNAPLIGRWASGNPGVISSSGNSITFRFYSDGGTSAAGFAANIECFGTALPVYNLSSGTVSTCSAMFYDAGGSQGNYPNFENRIQTFCSSENNHIQFAFNNQAFGLQANDTLWVYDGNTVSEANLKGIYLSGSFVENLVSSGTCLTFRFKSDATSNSQGWAALISCVSEVPGAPVYPMSTGLRVVCDGTFTDDGGLNGNYANGSSKVQTFRSRSGERLRFVFSGFGSESCCDYLEVYDGPTTAFPLVGTLYGAVAAGQTFTSTGNTLTFRWVVDGSTSGSGWAASIQCAGPALPTYNMSSGTVTTCSGVFYDASGGGANYNNSENRTQTFCSDNGQRPVFDFTNFSLQLGDTLWAYDGANSQANLIGAYTNLSRVEKITGSGTCVTFRFISNSNSVDQGWKALISCTATAPEPTVFAMSSGIRATCSGIFADDGGLTSSYSANQNRFQTFQSPAGQRLRFNFQQFSLENNYDFLYIYDGPNFNAPLIGAFTGNVSPGIVVSSGNSLTFNFYSNGNTPGNFAASIECFDAALPVFNHSSGITNACSGVFYDAGGSVGNYPIGENRTQTFCSGSAQKVQFTFNNSFYSTSLRAFRLSTNDTLFVYDGNSISSPLLAWYVQDSYVETLTSSGTCLTFRFKSDLVTSTTDQGWQALLKCTSVDPGPITYPMSSGLRVVNCNGVFTDDGRFGGNYSNNANMIQTFQSAGNQRLQFDFAQFRTNSGFDYLLVFDGPSINHPQIGVYSGTSSPGVLLSSGNSLTFWFISNSTSSDIGWSANISCGGPALPEFNMNNTNVNAAEGRFFDSGGPVRNYQGGENYFKTFCGTEGKRLVFRFNPLVSSMGVNDSLFVYDGNSTSSPLKAIYTLNDPLETLAGSGNCLTFRFRSASGSSGTGWAANFESTDIVPAEEYRMNAGVRVVCSGTFTDAGGPSGDYVSNSNRSMTLRAATPGAKLQLNFSEFLTQSNSDVLRIYDGNNTSGLLLGTYSGTNSPGIVSSTGSNLHFVWTTNSSTVFSGWKANIACVASVPLVGTLSAGSFCAGSNLSIPFTSPAQSAGNVFTAQLSDANGQFTNPVAIGTFSGTSSGQIDATLPSNLSQSGNYRIRIVASQPATTGNPSSPFTILTSPAQPGTISGNSSLCGGTTGQVYSIPAISGATSYNWSVPAGASLISGQGSTQITVDWGNTSGNLSVVAANGCGNSPASTRTITLNPSTQTTASISTNAVNNQVCQGASVIFSANTTSGPNPILQWMVNGVDVPGANGTQFILNNALSATDVSLRVSVTSGCYSPSVLVSNVQTITVLPQSPVSVSITNSMAGASICEGQSVQFSASLGNGGSQPVYSWRVNGSPVPNNSGSTFTSSTLQNGDQVSLVLTSNASCANPVPANSNTISMVVNPVLVPSVGISSNTGGSQICAGSSITLTANASNGGDLPQYQWRLNGSDIPGETNSTLTVSGFTGARQYSVRITSNALCASPTTVTSANFTVTGVNATQPQVSILSSAGTGPVCVGSILSFTATPVNGGSSPVYTWKVNGEIVPGQTGSTFISNALANNDVVTAELLSSDPCASPASASSNPVTVSMVSSLVPAVSASSSVSGNTICQGQLLTFTASATNGGANPQYQWSVNGGDVAGANQETFTTSTLANNAQVRVRLTSSISCASPLSVTSSPVVVTVNPGVQASVSIASSSGNSVCQGGSLTLSANPVQPGSNPQYQWFLGGNPIPGANASTYSTPSTLSAGSQSYSVQLTSNANCVLQPTVSSSAFVLQVQPSVQPSVVLTSNVQGNTICQGQSITFTANPENGGSNPQYEWFVNGNLQAGQTSAIFQTNTLQNGNSVKSRLTSNATCASPLAVESSPLTVTVTPSSPAQVSVSSSALNNQACAGQLVTFTANPVNGGSNPQYQWLVNGTEQLGETNAIFSTAALANGSQVQVRITSNSTCANPNVGTSAPLTLSVLPVLTPSVSISQVPGGTSFCAGTPITFTAQAQNGGSSPVYQWRINNNPVPNSNTASFQYTLSAAASVSVSLTSNATCASPASVNSQAIALTITPPPVLNLGGNQTACVAGPALTLTASPAGGTWQGANVNSSGVFTPSTAGTFFPRYTYTDPGTGCSATDSIQVLVNARPVINFGTMPSPCVNSNPVQLTATPAGGNWTGTGVNATGLFTPSTAGVGQHFLTYTASQNGCSANRVLVLTVSAPPTVDVGGPESVCFATNTVQLTGLPAGGTWSGEGVDANGTFTPGFVTPGTTVNLTYTVTVNGCSASKIKAMSVSFDPLSVNAGPDQTVCQGDPAFILSGVVVSGGTWSGPGVSPAGVFNPAQAGTGSINLTYTVTFQQSPGCSGSDTRTINVLATPPAPQALNDTVCGSGAAVLGAAGTSAQFRWYTAAVGGTPIAGQNSAQFITPPLTTSGTWYVSQLNGTCESPRAAVSAYLNSFQASFTESAGLLSATPPNATSYQWLLNGSAIPGAVGQTHQAVVSGDYSVRVLFEACADTSAQQFVLVNGAQDLAKPEAWTLLPNPSQGQFQIHGPAWEQAELRDLTGRLIRIYSSAPSGNLDATDLSNGLYLLQVRSVSGTAVLRVLIRK